MVGIPSPFGGDDGEVFDEREAYVPENLPEPGPFLAETSVLTGEAHVAVHEVAREVFEERGVYDMTFGYNLARLNADTRHPNAGYRYAEEADSNVLRAEFTPTTPFCPQSHTLTIGSFRAWNGLTDRHEYDVVRIRVHPMHQEAESINRRLAESEEAYRETGSVPDETTDGRDAVPPAGRSQSKTSGTEHEEAGYGTDAPF